MILSGDWGSSHNSLGMLKWLLSRFVALDPAQLYKLNFFLRKTGHAVSYGILCFLWFRAFVGQAGYRRGRSVLLSLGLCLLLALMDEGHQALTQLRGASILDVLLDLLGAGLAALITLAVWTPRAKVVSISQ